MSVTIDGSVMTVRKPMVSADGVNNTMSGAGCSALMLLNDRIGKRRAQAASASTALLSSNLFDSAGSVPRTR